MKESEEKGAKNEKAPAELLEWKKEIGELNDLIVLDMMAKVSVNFYLILLLPRGVTRKSIY